MILDDYRIEIILQRYDYEEQERKAMEEIAELLRAIARRDVANITEEIADCLIVLQQVKQMFGIMDISLQEAIEFKLSRQMERIKMMGDLQ